ncbi:hypothetical protein [Wolbachia endosymbiont of Ostrinia furnacalis]|nr:hypothetical protein [Wolbachia endosymbiont of Ostrinia furnacalis]URG40576.1 hypothetical protein M1L25_000048 [Wolbachia endosymbiont of Ostrinia furnacalis]
MSIKVINVSDDYEKAGCQCQMTPFVLMFLSILFYHSAERIQKITSACF